MSATATVTAPRAGAHTAYPFLKWAGGKGQLLSQLETFLPQTFRAYYEPFAGSAAVFFHLRRSRGFFAATLIDSNPDLIDCFEVIRDKPLELLAILDRHKKSHRESFYYHTRDKIDPRSLSTAERAARLIYLNKTCYNGLYRVNNAGRFNVPMGKYKRPMILDVENLVAANHALQGTKVMSGDFSRVLMFAKQGDLVYLDPPYYTDARGFTAYAVSANGIAGFGAYEHNRLANVVRELNRIGCFVVLSNSNTEYIHSLYADFKIHKVTARRFINCDGQGRNLVSELVITNR